MPIGDSRGKNATIAAGAGCVGARRRRDRAIRAGR
jgi:hypothetical protein